MTPLAMYAATLGLMLTGLSAIPAGGEDGEFAITCPMSAGIGAAVFLGVVAGSLL